MVYRVELEILSPVTNIYHVIPNVRQDSLTLCAKMNRSEIYYAMRCILRM